ncbi:MAG: DedA family protein, partial [Bauldia litoralis]
LVAVGTAAGIRNADLLPLFLVAWAGAFLGDNAGYALGRWFGQKAIRKFGAHIGLTEARMAGFEGTFARYGVFIVVAARFVVPLRQLNGLIAGSLHMPWLRFAVANAFGAALWVGVWLFLSSRVTNLLAHLDKLHGVGIAALVLGALAIVTYGVVRYRRHKRG